MEVNMCAAPSCGRSIRLDQAFCMWDMTYLPANMRHRLADLVQSAKYGEEWAVNELGDCIQRCVETIKAARAEWGVR